MLSWQMSENLVISPAAVDEHGSKSCPHVAPLQFHGIVAYASGIVENSFQIVPPTPLNGLLQNQQSTPSRSTVPANSPASNRVNPNGIFKPSTKTSIDPGQLRPSDSQYSLRSHRSNLSIGSVDSHISAFSGQWSTSDSISESDFNPHTILHPLPGQGHGRHLSLSIDPKLFQPKDKDATRPFGPPEKYPEETRKEGEPPNEEDLATAVPVDKAKKSIKPKTQGRKGKGTGMTAEERKKVSHARKVSRDRQSTPTDAAYSSNPTIFRDLVMLLYCLGSMWSIRNSSHLALR